MKRTVPFVRFLVMLACGAWLAAADPAEKAVEPSSALGALDEEMARFETVLGKIDDADCKGAAQKTYESFQERQRALRKAFDQAAYDEVRLKLLVEYQRLLLWMSPPRLPKPIEKEAGR